MADRPALYLPGTLCDQRLFEPLAGLLGFDAIFAPPIEHDNVGEAAHSASSLLDRPTIVVAFSLGGFVALEMLRQDVGNLAGLVLIAGNAQAIRPDNVAARHEELAFAREHGLAALIDRSWPQQVGPACASDESLRKTLRDMAESVGLERFERQIGLALSRPDSAATIGAARVPLLLISGDQDAMTSRERYRATAGDRGKWVELPDIGHFPPLEAPECCAAAIAGWEALPPCC